MAVWQQAGRLRPVGWRPVELSSSRHQQRTLDSGKQPLLILPLVAPPTPLAPRDLQEALAEGNGTAAAGGADTALPGCDAQAEEADGVRADDGEPACKSCSEMLLEEGTDYHISADLAIDGRPTAWCNYCQARAAQLE